MMQFHPHRRRQRYRVADIVARYLAWCNEHYDSREPSNHRCALARLTMHARSLDAGEWRNALAELRQANLSVSYQRGCHRRWLAMLSWACEHELLDAGTLHELQRIRFKPKRPTRSQGNDLIIIDEDWCTAFREKFWATVPLMPRWLAEISKLCFYTGARPKEIYTLTTAKIRTQQTQLVIVLPTHKTSSKIRTPRYIALNRPARLIIDRKLMPFTPDDWLWPAPKDRTRHISANTLQQALSRTIERNKLPKWTLYDCRRHAASVAVSQASPAAARALLGHRDLRTTSLYAIPSLNDAMLAAAAIENGGRA